MRKQEQRLWDSVRRNEPRGWWLERIENGLVPGMPDVHATSPEATPNWIELKAPDRPKRELTPLLGKAMRIEQINWHLKAASMGMRSWILIRDDHRSMFLVPGGLAGGVAHWPIHLFEPHKISWVDFWERLR